MGKSRGGNALPQTMESIFFEYILHEGEHLSDGNSGAKYCANLMEISESLNIHSYILNKCHIRSGPLHFNWCFADDKKKLWPVAEWINLSIYVERFKTND